MNYLVNERIKENRGQIDGWLAERENGKELPLYSSVDIRDAGYKVAVVDANLFPAGFNNLCPHGIDTACEFLRQAVLERVPGCRNILLVAEEHTRNTWYLENIRVLQQIAEQAGFHAVIATFLSVQPEFCSQTKYVELLTAAGHPIRIYCFKRILNEIRMGLLDFDLIILNNDLIAGIPPALVEADIPIYPSLHAGWHSRHKSMHFQYSRELIEQLSSIVGLDPWFFSCLDVSVEGVDINKDSDRVKIRDAAAGLFERINAKHAEHGIDEKPFIFIKADSGTYGMGVMPLEDPQQILNLNRKDRNRLYKGKGAQVINRYLLQEGVATIHQIQHQASEACIYQINNKIVGGFYRSHPTKGNRENLNSQGMGFKKMCPESGDCSDCEASREKGVFDTYHILARIAGIASYREIVELEASQK